jgi:hypothetical protein
MPISEVLRTSALEVLSEVRAPSGQFVYYQERDMGYGTKTEEGAGHHMNSPSGHEFRDPNSPNSPSNYEDEIVHPVMTVRPGERDIDAPDTTFHTQVYATEEKEATAPWGEQYAKPRDGGLGTYFEPATKPRGFDDQDYWDVEHGQQPRNHGSSHDSELGEQDNRYLFFDRTVYPSIPSVG